MKRIVGAAAVVLGALSLATACGSGDTPHSLSGGTLPRLTCDRGEVFVTDAFGPTIGACQDVDRLTGAARLEGEGALHQCKPGRAVVKVLDHDNAEAACR